MARTMLTGNAAAAWAARVAEVDYVPAFPITPQTEIIETLARWINSGEMGARMVTMDSEHSMLTAAGTAAATGVRVFTATSSQGFVYGFEMLYAIAGLRLPLVLVNVSRALAHPITLEPDHDDVLSARDTGFLQFHAENCLGGRRFRRGEFDTMLARIETPPGNPAEMAQPHLLFSADECREVGRFFDIAQQGDQASET